jgi:transposase
VNTRSKHQRAAGFAELGRRSGRRPRLRHIATDALEGVNTTIDVLKRQADGFRDMEYLKLRLAFRHESTPTVAG